MLRVGTNHEKCLSTCCARVGAYMWCNCQNWNIMWYVWPCGVLCDIDSLEYMWVFILYCLRWYHGCIVIIFILYWHMRHVEIHGWNENNEWILAHVVVEMYHFGWLWKYSLWLVVRITSSYHTHSWNIGTTVAISEKHWQHLFKNIVTAYKTLFEGCARKEI